MAGYVDGFVLPVPKRKLKQYKRMAEAASKVWMDHGALDYHECVIEDERAEFAQSYRNGLQPQKVETIIFAWIRYRSRKHRDSVNARVMKDPRLQEMCDPKNMPFDCQRMLYGGFEVLVAGKAKAKRKAKRRS